MERNLEKQIEYRNNMLNYYKSKLDKLEESKIMYNAMIEVIEKQIKDLE